MSDLVAVSNKQRVVVMVKNLRGGANKPFAGKRGSGTRFKNCVREESGRKGVRNPRALCAAIGRAKFGKRGMAKMSARGRRRR